MFQHMRHILERGCVELVAEAGNKELSFSHKRLFFNHEGHQGHQGKPLNLCVLCVLRGNDFSFLLSQKRFMQTTVNTDNLSSCLAKLAATQ